MREISVDLPALGKPTSPTSASSFSSRRSLRSSPGTAIFVLCRRLVRGCGKARIAFAAAAALCDHESVARFGEIVQHFAGFPIVNDGSYRDSDIDGLAFAAPAIAALAVTPRSALCSD